VGACGRAAGLPEPGTVRAVLVRPPHDTVRFTAPAVAHRCGRGAGVLVEGIVGGNGVLLWARSGDSSVIGDFPPITRGDSTTPRGAMASFRFMLGEDARGVTFDSGSVMLTRSDGRQALEAQVRGSGLEPVAGQRVRLEATFAAVPLAPASDTASCTVRL